jgi:hypothetical protein
MSVITTGKTFANGEQLSADKLNLMLDNATFSNDAVDLTSTFVDSSGAIVVRDSGITTSKLANNAVTTSKINDGAVAFEKLDDVIDDDTMATASDTTLATSESIKAYVNSMRPKFVNITGATLALEITKANTGSQDYTYNIADFTSDDSDFATNKITGLVVKAYATSAQSSNIVSAEFPDGGFNPLIRASADSTGDFDQAQTTTTVPINAGQTSIDLRLEVNNAQTVAARFTLEGFIIQPGL